MQLLLLFLAILTLTVLAEAKDDKKKKDKDKDKTRVKAKPLEHGVKNLEWKDAEGKAHAYLQDVTHLEFLNRWQKLSNKVSDEIGAKSKNDFSSKGVCSKQFPCQTITNASTAKLDKDDKNEAKKLKPVDIKKMDKFLTKLSKKKKVNLKHHIQKDLVYAGEVHYAGVVARLTEVNKKEMSGEHAAGLIFDAYKLIILEKKAKGVRAVVAQTDGQQKVMRAVCLFPKGAHTAQADNFCRGNDLEEDDDDDDDDKDKDKEKSKDKDGDKDDEDEDKEKKKKKKKKKGKKDNDNDKEEDKDKDKDKKKDKDKDKKKKGKKGKDDDKRNKDEEKEGKEKSEKKEKDGDSDKDEKKGEDGKDKKEEGKDKEAKQKTEKEKGGKDEKKEEKDHKEKEKEDQSKKDDKDSKSKSSDAESKKLTGEKEGKDANDKLTSRFGLDTFMKVLGLNSDSDKDSKTAGEKEETKRAQKEGQKKHPFEDDLKNKGQEEEHDQDINRMVDELKENGKDGKEKKEKSKDDGKDKKKSEDEDKKIKLDKRDAYAEADADADADAYAYAFADAEAEADPEASMYGYNEMELLGRNVNPSSFGSMAPRLVYERREALDRREAIRQDVVRRAALRRRAMGHMIREPVIARRDEEQIPFSRRDNDPSKHPGQTGAILSNFQDAAESHNDGGSDAGSDGSDAGAADAGDIADVVKRLVEVLERRFAESTPDFKSCKYSTSPL